MKPALAVLSFIALTISQQVMAGTATGTITVSLTIVTSSKVSSQASTNPADYKSAKALHMLTDAADGATVDAYLNGTKVGSAVSNQGLVIIQVSEALAKADNIQLTFKVGNQPVTVVQSAIEGGNNVIPKMTMAEKSQITSVPVVNADGSVSSQTVEARSVLIEY